MQTTVLHITPDGMPLAGAETVLNFRPFVDYLKKRKAATTGHKNEFLSYVIEKFEKQPNLLQPVDVNEVGKHADLLQLIYNTLLPVVEDEETDYWALCMPVNPTIFYSTNAFHNLVIDIGTGALRKNVEATSKKDMKRNQLEFRYSIILEKCYNIPSFFSREIVHSLQDDQTGLMRYFKMNIDARFIEVHPVGALPEFAREALRANGNYDHHELLPLLEEILPIDQFRFEGFGITSITDITADYAIEKIRNVILNHSDCDGKECFFDIISSLKAVVGDNNIEFGVLPVLELNKKLIFDDAIGDQSILMKASKDQGMAELTYLALAENYFHNPKLIFFSEITNMDESRHIYLKLLKAAGVKAFALIPVYFNNKLGGVLEVYSKKEGVLTESALERLDPAMGLLTQLLKNSITEFDNEIEKVIKEKFTSVQPAVQWKFNEVAWHYLRDKHTNSKPAEIGEIDFKQVYPLYGAVDIRNSTIERNAALGKDLQVQFTILIKVLKELKQLSGFGLLDEKIFLSQKWLEQIRLSDGFSQEMKLDEFLQNNIMPFLQHFKEGNAAYATIMDEYFSAIDENDGIAYENRRQLEASMTMVISSVNNYFEMMKGEIQQNYPSYFEKFRTDGVEYDIYIGQSIAPDKPFSDIYLKNLRLMQLTSMAAISKYTHSLIKVLPRPVETTQLIFIHSHPIDIKFRKDEKRFDVEGSYNIRYHIIKKRIDKVRIKQTKERLTQPNKISLVYFNQHEANEYIGYIQYLQQQNMLADDLEELELENLQGVSGLKALRVSVIVDGE